jgi:carbamoyl-phosphate synthase large subunit
VARVGEGGTNAVDLIRDGRVGLVVNTPKGGGPRADGAHIRMAAARHGVSLLTTVAAARAAARGLAEWRAHRLEVRPTQSFHP